PSVRRSPDHESAHFLSPMPCGHGQFPPSRFWPGKARRRRRLLAGFTQTRADQVLVLDPVKRRSDIERATAGVFRLASFEPLARAEAFNPFVVVLIVGSSAYCWGTTPGAWIGRPRTATSLTYREGARR